MKPYLFLFLSVVLFSTMGLSQDNSDCSPFIVADTFPYGGITSPFKSYYTDFCLQVLAVTDEQINIDLLLKDSSKYKWSPVDPSITFEKSTTYWFKIDFVNDIAETYTAWFWVLNRGWKELEVFAPIGEKQYVKQIISPDKPLKDKKLPYWMPFFEADLSKGNNTVFLRLRSIDPNLLAGQVIPPDIMQVDPLSFSINLPFRTYYTAILHGILIIQFLFFAIIYLLTKDRTILYLTVFLAGYALYDLHESLFKEEFSPIYWGYESYWVLFLRYPATLIFVFGLIKFTETYLDLPSIFAQSSKWINIYIVSFIILSFFAYLDENTVYAIDGIWVFQVYRIFAFLFFLFVMIVPFVGLYYNKPNAVTLLIGVGPIAMSGIIGMLIAFGILPYFMPYRDIFRIGITLSMVLLAFGAGQRILLLRRQETELEKTKEIDELKTKFYTNITHEFRTPLTVIQGITEQIKGHENEKAFINRNSQQLLNLVNNMLDLSKIEAGKLTLNLVHGDILSYLRYVTESFHSLALNQKINLNFYANEEVIDMDYDPEKILQVLSNLISNAIKFTPEYGKVLVRAEVQSGETFEVFKTSEVLSLTVKDTGIGIAADQLPHIFDRFYRPADSHTEGTGIGLALTKELVELMEGEISVESRVGEGSVFTVVLPIRKTLDKKVGSNFKVLPTLSTLATSKQQIDSEPITTTQERPILLIVEDNLDVMHYLSACLKDHYQLQYARNGREGIEKALEVIPDIIISDVMMPEKDGFELCATLKQNERTSHIPIILLTAKADMESKLEGLEYGADAYLTKPFHRRELDVRLQKLLELRRKLRTKYNQPSFETEISTQREDVFVAKVRQVVLENLDDETFGVEELAAAVNFSAAHVYRKLKALTGKSTSHFIRQIRLQEAYKMLHITNNSVSEIAYAVGFKEVSYFSRLFSKHYGKTASEVLKEKNMS